MIKRCVLGFVQKISTKGVCLGDRPIFQPSKLGLQSDLALGGDGNNQFFVGTGGNNLLSGGAGADIFNIFTGENPSALNTILDFQIGTDVIGFIGAGVGFGFANLVRTGNDIAIIGGNAIATLTGVDTSSLTASNFIFK